MTNETPALLLPGEPAPVRLMNTIWADTAGVHDDLTTPAAQSRVESVDDGVAAVNRAAAHLPQTELVLQGGLLRRDRPASASPTRVALAELAHDSIDMLTGPSGIKLVACHAPRCLLYFVRSQPRREWCSETCGNRARAARHYQRIRAARNQG